ncbi:MAG TPA: xanthine dehydrogenase accessory protein XdhC [Thermoanaerobaculia bacterium]|nr:xanthine dehydrogenase accessory protein XdhC [Thermoanaerobaculia bacterium]
MPTWFEALNDLFASGEPFAAVTVVDTMGSVPQDRGAKMLVTRRGLHHGTVGGGKVETRAIEEARRMIEDPSQPATRFFQWNLNRDVGMTCGGTVRLFVETHNVARWNVVIFGAGHVANALVRVLLPLECTITCIDPRPEWLERLPEAPNLRKVQAEEMPREVGKIPEGSFVLLISMGHTTDKPILLEILRTRTFPYLGVIGSNAKAKQLRLDVVEAGLPEEMQRSFFCPVGLDLGSNHPQEIAISIAAQLLAERERVTQGV